MKNIFLIGLLLLSLTACDKNERLGKSMKTMTHINGLVVKIYNDFYNVIETKSGFKFNFSDESSRSINELEVTKQSHKPKNITTFEEKNINGNTYYFKLSSENIGSGGKEYTLTIWKPEINGGVLLVHYIQQDKLPEFDAAWDIIEKIN